MMSNPPSALERRRQLHRRQNSTPVLNEAMRAPGLPPTIQRAHSHRRGQSLDQRSPIRRQHHQATGSTVSIANLGSTPQGQQILREAQQQNIARPGQQRIEIPISPQCGTFPDNTNVHYSPSPYGPMYSNSTTMNAIMQSSGNSQITHSPYHSPNMNMPMSAGLEDTGLSFDENSQHYFQSSHDMQHSFGDEMMNSRRQSQPSLQIYTEPRPVTPAEQINAACLPLTPATTPFMPTMRRLQYSRSLQSSPIKRYTDEEIMSPHPISMQRGRSLEGIVEAPETHDIPSPPGTAPLMQNAFDMAEMPILDAYASQAESAPFEYGDAGNASAQLPPQVVKQQSSQCSPETVPLPFFDETGGEVPKVAIKAVPVLTSSQPRTASSSPVRAALSPRRMSITDLNLEPGINASIEETNVTLDDIAQFIEGPDPADNKWICKYEDCNKRFGRKENIKSHVQTHLGDRQFRCDHCSKCFVRGHDLKRHAKIHTGTKPYPCLCGNAFARHDALTRHRQRGMCIGAFEGVVKKAIKRGRPRKHRPEMDDRVEKSTRTRERVNERQYQYLSSSSESESSSWGSPPTEDFETMSIQANSQFDDIALFDPASQTLPNETVGFPPDLFSFTPPDSPGYSTGNRPSPGYQAPSPTDFVDFPELPATVPMSSSVTASSFVVPSSQHRSPPSLSHSGSSPAPDCATSDFVDYSVASTFQQEPSKVEETMNLSTNDFDKFFNYESLGLEVDDGTDGDSLFGGS